MRIRIVAALAAAALVAVCCSVAWAALAVKADKENVVASRLAGEWQPHVELTKRLTGRAKVPPGGLSFRSDPAIAGKIPAKYDKFLGKKHIYMAGMLKRRGKEHPFVLIEHRGNPHVVYFRERGGDPLGDAESFNVMLAVSKEKGNDLLFIGGDFNNQPFSAFERSRASKR